MCQKLLMRMLALSWPNLSHLAPRHQDRSDYDTPWSAFITSFTRALARWHCPKPAVMVNSKNSEPLKRITPRRDCNNPMIETEAAPLNGNNHLKEPTASWSNDNIFWATTVCPRLLPAPVLPLCKPQVHVNIPKMGWDTWSSDFPIQPYWLKPFLAFSPLFFHLISGGVKFQIQFRRTSQSQVAILRTRLEPKLK